MELRFGKYRGFNVDELPVSYLDWILAECDMYRLDDIFKAEVDRVVDHMIEFAADVVMPYGKYAGMRLGDLPESYLQWLAEQREADNPDSLLSQCVIAVASGDARGEGKRLGEDPLNSQPGGQAPSAQSKPAADLDDPSAFAF